MKRNLLQLLTLCLCIVLLVITLMQGRKLDEYRMEMENRLQNMENSLNNEIQRVSGQVEWELEEAAKVISGYTLEPAGIDAENHALLADVTVTLKQWYEDTEVILLAEVGGNKQNLPMTSVGNGGFDAEVSLPMEGNPEISLEAQITGGGLTRRETLQSWGDCSMLLPLRYSGGGWSGPDYRNGVLSSRFTINIEADGEKYPTVANAEFRIFRNGELAQTVAAVPDPYGDPGAYRPDTPDYDWQMECAVGDVIEVRFRCEDEYGLGYDFLFQNWIVEGETADEYASGSGISVGNPGSSGLTLFWP